MSHTSVTEELIALTTLVIVAFALPDPYGFWLAVIILAGWFVIHPRERDQIAGYLTSI